SLLDAVKDQPDEDGPRLFLADWLEQRGHSEADRCRGAFIRLQTQSARLSAHDPARQQLEVRATALKHEHLSAWSGDWQTLVTNWPGQDGLWFERGLLRPNLTGVSWLRGVPPDHPAWTWVDGLKLLGLSPQEVSSLASSHVLGKLNHLDL